MYRYVISDSINLIDITGFAPGDTFLNYEDAAVDAIRYIWNTYPDSMVREYCGWIRRDGDCFTYDEPNAGSAPEDIKNENNLGECSTGPVNREEHAAWYHNHIKKADFSGMDKAWTDFTGKTGYSGIRDEHGREVFHHFIPGWHPDNDSSRSFVPRN